MAEKPGYWDLHRCAWVEAPPASHDFPHLQPGSDGSRSPTADTTVPEQRADLDAPLVPGAPD